MSGHPPSQWERLQAWGVPTPGRDGADHDIGVAALRGSLVDMTGGHVVPAVEIVIPEETIWGDGLLRLPATVAAALGIYLQHAADVANAEAGR